MKKILATVLFCTLFSFSLVSCGGKNNKVSAISGEEQNKEVTEGEKGNPIEKLDVCIGPSPETMDPPSSHGRKLGKLQRRTHLDLSSP